MNFLGGSFWYIIVGGIIAILALIGLLLFLRNQGDD
jgi:hypothetical protein